MKVYPFRPGYGMGNIMWDGAHPMRAGVFPKTHPVAPGQNTNGFDQIGSSDAMVQFRELSYWASCFPEGDGITWKPLNGQSDAQCLADIKSVFGDSCKWAPGVSAKPAPARDGEGA